MVHLVLGNILVAVVNVHVHGILSKCTDFLMYTYYINSVEVQHRYMYMYNRSHLPKILSIAFRRVEDLVHVYVYVIVYTCMCIVSRDICVYMCVYTGGCD